MPFQITFSPQIVFISLALFLFIFVFWSEGVRDGFDKNQLFDLIFSLLGLSALLYVATTRWIYNLQVFHYDSLFLLIAPKLLTVTIIYVFWVIGIVAFAQNLKWSVFRVLDIFALALTVMLFPIVAAITVSSRSIIYLNYYLPYLVSYSLIFSKRNSFGYVSGVGFILLNVLHIILLLVLIDIKGRLLISLFLLTICLVTAYFRKKITVSNSNLSKNFIDLIKGQLKSKEQDLSKQENLIRQEDPYMREGRAQENSEDMDDAILEDSVKEISDARLGLIRSMRVQVKRALAFLKMGKYGICEICGKPIDPARLKVYPEATTCIEHASKSNR